MVFGSVRLSFSVFGELRQSILVFGSLWCCSVVLGSLWQCSAVFFFIFAKVRRKIMTQEFNIKKVLMQQSLGIRISLGHAASRI